MFFRPPVTISIASPATLKVISQWTAISFGDKDYTGHRLNFEIVLSYLDFELGICHLNVSPNPVLCSISCNQSMLTSHEHFFIIFMRKQERMDFFAGI